MKLLDAQAASLAPAVVNNSDGTFSRKLDASAAGTIIPLSQAMASALVPAVTDNGDGTFSEKVKAE